jgi:hypothetical protein
MANRRITLTKEGTARLEKVMVELGLEENRPEALRLALAKGLVEATGEPPEPADTPGGFTIGDGAIAKDEEYAMYKHLIIEKLQRPVEDKEIDKYIHRFLEIGLKCMEQEINQLSSLDNYLLFLVEKHRRS